VAAALLCYESLLPAKDLQTLVDYVLEPWDHAALWEQHPIANYRSWVRDVLGQVAVHIHHHPGQAVTACVPPCCASGRPSTPDGGASDHRSAA
jgi:hypothetical protein